MAKVYEVMQANESFFRIVYRNGICPADIAYLGLFLEFKAKWNACKDIGGKKSDILKEIAESHRLSISALSTRFKRLDSECSL